MSPINDKYTIHEYPSLGKYLDRVDRVMTQVDRITEDIDHMPVAAFIFRDNESREVQYSHDMRLNLQISKRQKIFMKISYSGTACLLLW